MIRRTFLFLLISTLFVAVCSAQQKSPTNGLLTSGQYFVTQSWSQESNFRRPYHVRVPRNSAARKLPVCVFLHGNGGTGFGAMRSTMRLRPKLAEKYVMVFPDGYERSWNIVSEWSKADDRAFVEAIVSKLASHSNIQQNNFTVIGNSNGAALVNQLAVECQLPNIRNYISIVSPLNEYQHRDDAFHFKGDDNSYREVANPRAGIKLMNVSGTHDPLVPYHGGPSRAIPAKDGKLVFLSGERSTYLWAKEMGYHGDPLSQPTRTDGSLDFYSYLDGDVVHVKVNGQGHNAGSRIRDDLILRFIEGEQGRP